MIDYGSAYVFNMMPIDVGITLNNGNKRYIRRISGSEPFDPSYCIFERSFEDDKPKDLLGNNNNISIYGNNNGIPAKMDFQTDPYLWNIVRDIQIYLFYENAVAKCGREEDTYNYIDPISQKIPGCKNATAYFFNLTGQRILLTLNSSGEGNDEKDSRMIPSASEAAPFTPSYVSFPRAYAEYPPATFGIKNKIKFLLASSKAHTAQRTFECDVPISSWPLSRHIQIYLLDECFVVRMDGNGESYNYQ
jgi:hypothetical protein